MTACLRRLTPILTAGALLAASLAGCSSAPPPEAQAPGTLPGGTATVSIDGQDAGTSRNVSCQTVGTTTTVTTGDEQTGSTAVISTDPSVLVRSASIRDLGGFTGNYSEGLGEPADVTVAGRTYHISGTADGFATDNPSFRKSGKFSIKVAC